MSRIQSPIPHQKQKGSGTIAFMRDVNGAADLSIASMRTEADVSAAIAAAADFCFLGCLYGIDPPGFTRGTLDDEQCLEEGTAPVYDPAKTYTIGDTVQPTGSIEGLAGKVCYEALRSGTLGPPPNPGDWKPVDCGCARPEIALGSLEKETRDFEIAFSPSSAVDLYLGVPCEQKRQIVIMFPRIIRANQCLRPIWTYCGYVVSYQPQRVTREDFMKADVSFCLSGKVVKGHFVETLTPAEADQIIGG